MKNKELSIYFGICIITKLLLVYGVKNTIYSKKRYIFMIIYTIFAIGLLYQYITKYRKKGAFNQSIWWDFLRPIHSIIYLIVIYLIYNKNKLSYLLLLLDIIISIIFHIKYRYLI